MLAVALFLLAFQWPPAEPGTVVSKCEVNDSKLPGQPKIWLVHLTLRSREGVELTYVISHREADEEKKALLDCYDATKHYEKLARREGKK